MRALVQDEDSGELVLGEVPDLVPGPGQVLVTVHAAGVNRADLLQREGRYPPPQGESPLIGLEVAGTVAGLGTDVTGWSIGDRVCALLPSGGYAEQVVVPAGLLMPVPERLSLQEAAGIPETFLTAYLNLVTIAGLRAGETALIHAGASGVGTSAIQIAREIGAVPIATVGSAAKAQACLDLGASTALVRTDGPFEPAVLTATSGRGADVVLDPVGASSWEQNAACIAADGRWVVIGGLGGYDVTMNIRRLMQRRVQLTFSTLRSRSLQDKVALTAAFTEFGLDRLADGRLAPIIDSVLGWQDAMTAHRRLEENRTTGKIVLAVDQRSEAVR
ncbi:NAD(P)H-quinone oxidoreductase [Pseudactinotalea sp.]|uniref:NAD(P)H-quinone oxidoreductase n=1 Tax=Pseudactinotalea sp. TaxID=1926260 RepID=UPI003B3A937F